MNRNTSDLNHIHSLIDRYFDATASEAEELELRTLLADQALSSEKINEARAVLGFFSVERRDNGFVAKQKISRRGWMSAAAAIVVALVCGLTLLHVANDDNVSDQCYAYIGNQKITDKERIFAIMQADLSMLGEASQSLHSDFETQLSSLANELSL